MSCLNGKSWSAKLHGQDNAQIHSCRPVGGAAACSFEVRSLVHGIIALAQSYLEVLCLGPQLDNVYAHGVHHLVRMLQIIWPGAQGTSAREFAHATCKVQSYVETRFSQLVHSPDLADASGGLVDMVQASNARHPPDAPTASTF